MEKHVGVLGVTIPGRVRVSYLSGGPVRWNQPRPRGWEMTVCETWLETTVCETQTSPTGPVKMRVITMVGAKATFERSRCVSVQCLRATTTAVASTIPATTPTSGVLRRPPAIMLGAATCATVAPACTATAAARAAVIPSVASATNQLRIKNSELRMRAWPWGCALFVMKNVSS